MVRGRGEGDEWNVDCEWDESGECYVEGGT